MQTESIELGFLSIFALITFFIFLITEKISFRTRDGVLLDEDFSKPQSFHSEAIPRSGGVASIIALFFFISIYFILYSKIFYEYLFISSSLFFVGYLDDIKKNISPKLRLLLMIIFLLIFINILSIEIRNLDLVFLKFWLENKIFSNIFILLCFLLL